MKTNSSVRLSALAVMLVLVVMLCSMFSVAYAETDSADKDYINVLTAEDGVYAINYDKSGMLKGAKYFYDIALVEKKGRKYTLTLLQKGSDVKMNEMRIEKPRVIEAKTKSDGDRVHYTFEVDKKILSDNLKCTTYVPKMGMRPPFELKIDVTKGYKFKDLDSLLENAANPEDSKVVLPTGMIVGIVVMVVVVVAIIATIVIVVVKKSKKKKAINAVVEDAKSEPVAEPVVEEAPAVEEVTEDASADNKKEN